MAGKLFNVRMEDDQREAIDKQAAADGLKSSVWAREALAAVVELGGLTELATILTRRRNGDSVPAGPHSPRALALQGRSRLVEDKPKCPHPKSARVVHPYATMCGECGERIR